MTLSGQDVSSLRQQIFPTDSILCIINIQEMKVATQHSAAIAPFQWEAFDARIELYHPDETYTQVNRKFLDQLISDDGKLLRKARTSCIIIRDELCELIPYENKADLVPFIASPIARKVRTLMGFVPDLMRALNRRQEQLPLEGLNEGQELFKFLELEQNSIPQAFLIDIGAFLGFRHTPQSNSWHLAGKAYLLRCMCKNIFLTLYPDAVDELPNYESDGDNDADSNNGDDNDDDGDADGDDQDSGSGDNNDNASESGEDTMTIGSVIRSFKTNDTHAAKLKLCVFSVWHDHYANEFGAYHKEIMTGDWLREGIELFRKHTHFSYDVSCFSDIAQTAANWIVKVSQLTSLVQTEDPPAGQWFQALNNHKMRKKWLQYYAILMLKRKTQVISTRKRHTELQGTSNAAQNRRRLRHGLDEATGSSSNNTSRHEATPSSGNSATSAGGFANDMLSFRHQLQESQDADRAWISDLQKTATEREEARHQELLAGFRGNENRHREMMTGLQALIAIMQQARQPAQPMYYSTTNAHNYAAINDNTGSNNAH